MERDEMKNKNDREIFLLDQRLLLNPITSSVLTEDNFQTLVARCLANAPTRYDFQQLIVKLLKQSKFRRKLNAYPVDKDKFSCLPVFNEHISIERLFDFSVALFCHEAGTINSFIVERDRFEDALLKSNYVIAEEILDSVAESHGISLWLIRSRTILLSYQGKDSEIFKYCTKEKEDVGSGLINSLIDYFQIFSNSDPDNCLRLHNTLIQKRSIEFRESNWHPMASLLSTLFSPLSFDALANPSECIYFIQTFPLVDQYLLFLMIVQRLAIDEICSGDKNDISTFNIIKTLIFAITDSQLDRVNALQTKSVSSDTSEIGWLIFQEYEAGNYQQAIDLFESRYGELANCIPYLNLIAKAYAYTKQSPKNIPTGIVLDLLEKLTPIYTLEADHIRTEEHLWSRVIRLRGLTQSANIQMSIHLAMPHRYLADDTRRVAVLSAISSKEFTPVIKEIFAGSSGMLWQHNNMPISSTPPAYRKMKYDLCLAIKNHQPTSEIDTLFENYRESTPLFKDYIELYSEYCILSAQFHRLLQVSAEALVKDPNIYACIPMDYLSEEIATQFCTNLYAVIVAFYYSRKISKSINRLLNEIFEEYILTTGAERPSELLSKKEALTELEVIFYREICIPDVMDCLTCFDNINDLRAERIRILDLLLKLNAIDNALRSQEVEELVGKSIVDAAMAGMNGGKVFVDVDALRKILAKEVKSLFEAYKVLPMHDDSRATLSREGLHSEENPNAYIIGPKNSQAFKLYNLHLELFLFDENFGLDMNLSTEIRHGFFSNYMRSLLKDRLLITEILDNDQYASNSYWKNQYSIVNDDIWDAVDNKLKEFSSGFNELVNRAEEWMNIRISREQTNRIFFYEFSAEISKDIQEKMDESDDSEEMSIYIFELLEKQTDGLLCEVRDRLHSNFQVELDALLGKLVDDIDAVKRGAAFVDLLSVIRQAQGDLKERVITAAEWFKSAAQLSNEKLPFDRVVEIATTTFQNINGNSGNMELTLTPSLKTVYMTGHSVKPFTIAINNLLDNCYKRSGLGSSVHVKIYGEQTVDGAVLTIQNNMSSDAVNLARMRQLHGSDNLHIAPISSRLMRTEGGSGLVKAANQIASASEKSTLHIELADLTFRARIDCVI
jgi:hypothetical protein